MSASHLLVLYVRDAKLFRPSKRDTHRMVVASGAEAKRAETPGAFVECPMDTFLASSVSGALHVLAGERPVPTIRRNTLPGAPERIDVLDEMAKSAKVAITSGIAVNDEGNYEAIPRFGESITARKSMMKSTVPMPAPVSIDSPSPRMHVFLTWDRFRGQLGKESAEATIAFIASCLSITDDVESHSFVKVIQRMRANHLEEFVQFLASLEIPTPWMNLIGTGNTSDGTWLRMGYQGDLAIAMQSMTISRGFEMVATRNAVIYIPVTAEQASMFSKGPGWATILDGGLVTIGTTGKAGLVENTPIRYAHAKPTFNPAGLSCI